MSDAGLPIVRPKHSRSTSITTSKKTTSHQRKPSLNVQQELSENSKRHSSSGSISNSTTRRPSLTPSSSSANAFKSSGHSHRNLPRFINSVILRIHAFLNPSGPLLPHTKHGNAFGGTAKPSVVTSLVQSRVMRFVALFYVIFSVFLSLNHTWKYFMSADSSLSVQRLTEDVMLDDQFNDDWVPQRTYDQGKQEFEHKYERANEPFL
jgi:hypothetical protein